MVGAGDSLPDRDLSAQAAPPSRSPSWLTAMDDALSGADITDLYRARLFSLNSCIL